MGISSNTTIRGIIITDDQVMLGGEIVTVPVTIETQQDYMAAGWVHARLTNGIGPAILFNPGRNIWAGFSDPNYDKLEEIYSDWIKNQKLGTFLSKLN
jgi:hypothetical protein